MREPEPSGVPGDQPAPLPFPSPESPSLAFGGPLQMRFAAVSPHLDVLSKAGRRDLWFEMAVAVSIGILPLLVSSLAWHAGWREGRGGHSWLSSAVTYQMHNLMVALPVLWIMHRSGLAWSYFGVVRPRVRDFGWGLAVLAAMWVLAYGSQWVLWLWCFGSPLVAQALTVVPPQEQAREMLVESTRAPWGIFWVSMVVTTSVEELFTRAYLVPALARLWRNPWLASIGAAALMSSYHVYQGSYAVVLIFLSQCVLNGIFWRYRCIWPFMVAHAAYDAILFAQYS